MNSHHEKELELLADFIRDEKVTRYLEIGARNGISVTSAAKAMPPNSVITIIDLADGPWGGKTEHNLRQVRADIRYLFEHQVNLLFADSTSERAIGFAKEYGPYDLVYIDADHRYESVMNDWKNYGPMCRIVAFDDICATPDKKPQICEGDLEFGVYKLWDELIGDGKLVHAHFKATEDTEQGIGIVFRKHPLYE